MAFGRGDDQERVLMLSALRGRIESMFGAWDGVVRRPVDAPLAGFGPAVDVEAPGAVRWSGLPIPGEGADITAACDAVLKALEDQRGDRDWKEYRGMWRLLPDAVGWTEPASDTRTVVVRARIVFTEIPEVVAVRVAKAAAEAAVAMEWE